MDHLETIEKIFKLRKKLGMKQKDMAGMINVDRNTLSRWENKKNMPSKLAIRKMKEILRFRPSKVAKAARDLVLGKFPPPPILREGENNGKENNEK